MSTLHSVLEVGMITISESSTTHVLFSFVAQHIWAQPESRNTGLKAPHCVYQSTVSTVTDELKQGIDADRLDEKQITHQVGAIFTCVA